MCPRLAELHFDLGWGAPYMSNFLATSGICPVRSSDNSSLLTQGDPTPPFLQKTEAINPNVFKTPV